MSTKDILKMWEQEKIDAIRRGSSFKNGPHTTYYVCKYCGIPNGPGHSRICIKNKNMRGKEL